MPSGSARAGRRCRESCLVFCSRDRLFCVRPASPAFARTCERIGRALERQGVLARDAESSYLALEPDAGGAMDDLLGHSITYSASSQ